MLFVGGIVPVSRTKMWWMGVRFIHFLFLAQGTPGFCEIFFNILLGI